MLALDTALPEPRRTLRAGAMALQAWTRRQVLAAAGFTVAFALLLGIPTVLIPNPVFGRAVPVTGWSYPVWVLSSLLAGMLTATYVRPGTGPGAPVARSGRESEAAEPDPGTAPGAGDVVLASGDAPARFGMAGTVLAWFAVGCPVCNKLALLALGYAGALRWFAPAQPYLAGLALITTAGALLVRLRGQVLCPARPNERSHP